MENLFAKLVVRTLSGLLVLVLGAIILNKLGLGEQSGSLAAKVAGTFSSAATEESDSQNAPGAAATASSQATGEKGVPEGLATKDSAQATSMAGTPASSANKVVSNWDDGICRPRVMMVQNRTWPRMQRFLDPDNQECLIVADRARLSVVIQSCGGRIANTGYVNIVADYNSAYVGVSYNMNEGYRGVALVREPDGSVPSQELSLKGSFLNVIVNGIGGEFCGVDMRGFTPSAES